LIHVPHFPNLPCGEITIEGTSFPKHCTTQHQRKVQNKNGLEKKEKRALFKIELAQPQKEEGKYKSSQ
jgi:hypothetical protein